MTKKEINKKQRDNSTSITFNIEGDKYDTFANRKFQNRKPYQPDDPGKITAFMPGVIRKIYVKPEDKVKEGTKLLVLEAMKMKNILFAPAAGLVKKINVDEGKMVTKDHILVELELTPLRK